MDTTLATNADAQLILKLYELRTEAGLRAARKWVVGEFWPKSAEELLTVLRDFNSQQSAYLRQVVSYWDMTAALVLHGAINAELFFDCNGENLFIFSKISNFIPAIHTEFPGFFARTQELVEKYPSVRKRLESLKERLALRAGNQAKQ